MTIDIGIDGYNLALPQGTGIATYARTLCLTIAQQGWQTMGLFEVDVGARPALQETLFFDRLERPPAPRKSRLARWRARRPAVPAMREFTPGSVDVRPLADRIPSFDRIATGDKLFQAAFRHFRKTRQMVTLNLDTPPSIMHWTCPLPLRIAGAHNVYTVHDLVPLRMPYMTLEDKQMHHDLVLACVEAADHLCSVSEITARELIELAPRAESKLTTTYQTCDIVTKGGSLSRREGSSIVRKLGLDPGHYFLFYGALEPKKNVARLIEAHARLDSSTPLVLVTGRSWNSPTENSILAQMGNRNSGLIVLDYLPRAMLQSLVMHAKAVTFPSLHEGFGLPVLEAMEMGVPVLTGNTGGVVEVAGDAALLIDPYDVADIRDGLKRLDEDESLRQMLSAKGPVQAARFSPSRYADTMAKVYRRLLDPTTAGQDT